MSTIQEISYTIDVLQTLIWQYNEAQNITQLVFDKNEWLINNYSNFWESWFSQVFNLWNDLPEEDPLAFTDFGCAVWAIILGIPLVIPNPGGEDYLPFGFENFNNFNNAPFISEEIVLSRQARLLVLRLRYFQLITRGAVLEINAFMDYLIKNTTDYIGRVYVIDNHDMTLSYVFTQPLSSELGLILDIYDILPRPAAVGINIIIAPDLVFGFENFQNFNNGPFVLER